MMSDNYGGNVENHVANAMTQLHQTIERQAAEIEQTKIGAALLIEKDAEIARLRAAAKAFDEALSTDCDCHERDDLRRVLEQGEQKP